GFVKRKDDVGGVADLEVLLEHDPEGAQLLDLVEERLGIDDHPVAEDAEFVRMKDAGRDEPQREVFVAELHRMPGIVPALVAGHDVEGFAEKIDDLSLPLVAPLSANDCKVFHAAGRLAWGGGGVWIVGG